MHADSDPLQELREALSSAGRGVESVKIGIVDGLPDLAHRSLQGATIEVLQMMVPTGLGIPNQHATNVCSVIFGSGDDVQGIAPGCSGLVLPIFFEQQAEGCIQARPVSQLDLARAITFALEFDVAILNVSAGQKVWTPAADVHLDQALRRCAERRVLVVAAVGNDSCACVHLPAGIMSVLAVGAANKHGQPLEISNWGDPYRQNGLLAPGEGITVAALGDSVSSVSGTSIATAVVSGVAALLLSVARREGYQIDAIDIQQMLLESAAPCRLEGEGTCDRYLVGRLDAGATLAMLHIIGANRRIARPNFAAEPSPHAGDDRQLPASKRDSNMTSATCVPKNAAIPDPTGVAPAACGCQTKAEEAVPNEEKSPKLSARPRASVPAVMPSGFVNGVSQQTCSCGQPPQIVYALGAVWFDFGSEARHDVFLQQLRSDVIHPIELVAFLRDPEHRHFAAGLTFILMQEQVPLYAIQPTGPFAPKAYDKLLDAIQSSLDDTRGVDQRMSIPGVISGTIRLMNGMNVPIIYPDPRAMYTWRSQDLIENTRDLVAQGLGVRGEHVDSDDQLLNFLHRVYDELRNLGVAPRDRALNYAATNAFQARQAFALAAAKSLVLDEINVVKSPICRPDSDCWDIELSMFDDENDHKPNRIYRFTVDVSEVIPVTVGTPRTWAKPSR
jgi:cyanobactin maturation PatA/PatG family protease